MYTLVTQSIHETLPNSRPNGSAHLNGLALRGDDGQYLVIVLLMELDSLGVVKDAEEVGLNGVGV